MGFHKGHTPKGKKLLLIEKDLSYR